MPNIFSQYASAEGRRILTEKLKFFEGVIAKLEDIYDIRPFGLQSAQSLLGHNFSKDAIMTKRLPYERLDQLTIDIITGTR